MTEIKPYRAKPARGPLQFWWQPFVMLLLVLMLCRLLPVSAVLYKSRVVQPLPAAHVFYVNLDPDYALEILRISMQTWRRSNLGGSGSDGMSMDVVELSVPLDAPEFLEQGSRYPGTWTPGVVTPLAQSLPDLLCATAPFDRYGNLTAVRSKQTGFHAVLDPALIKARFSLPEKELSDFKGSGHCRFYVETLEDGSVEHVLCLSSSFKEVNAVERAMHLGRAKGAVRGEVELWWRNP